MLAVTMELSGLFVVVVSKVSKSPAAKATVFTVSLPVVAVFEIVTVSAVAIPFFMSVIVLLRVGGGDGSGASLRVT